MKKLHLVLKGEWFDMIDSGVKLEEYREITQYWINRLCWHEFHKKANDLETLNYCRSNAQNGRTPYDVFNTSFDGVEFQHGYSKTARRMTFEFKGIEIRTGNPNWGAELGKEYFVIKLGKRIC